MTETELNKGEGRLCGSVFTLLTCSLLLLTGCAASASSPAVPFDEPTIQGSLPSAPSVEDLLSAAPTLAPIATDEPSPDQPPADVAAAADATYEQFKALPKADQLTYVTWVFRDYEKFLADYKMVGGNARDFTLPSQSLTNTAEQIESTNVILDRMMIARNDPLVRRKLNYAMRIDGDLSADLDRFEQYMNDNLGDGPGRSARVQAAKGGLVLPDDHDTDKQPMLRKDSNGSIRSTLSSSSTTPEWPIRTFSTCRSPTATWPMWTRCGYLARPVVTRREGPTPPPDVTCDNVCDLRPTEHRPGYRHRATASPLLRSRSLAVGPDDEGMLDPRRQVGLSPSVRQAGHLPSDRTSTLAPWRSGRHSSPG